MLFLMKYNIVELDWNIPLSFGVFTHTRLLSYDLFKIMYDMTLRDTKLNYLGSIDRFIVSTILSKSEISMRINDKIL